MRNVFLVIAVFSATTIGMLGSTARADSIFSYSLARDIVTLEYKAFLFRDPEGGAGPFTHADRIVTRGNDGLLADAMDFADSDEFLGVTANSHSPEEILSNIYSVFFHRPVDDSGRDSWLPLLNAGKYREVFFNIVGSDEFYGLYIEPHIGQGSVR